jgi:hypothetical protein
MEPLNATNESVHIGGGVHIGVPPWNTKPGLKYSNSKGMNGGEFKLYGDREELEIIVPNGGEIEYCLVRRSSHFLALRF